MKKQKLSLFLPLSAHKLSVCLCDDWCKWVVGTSPSALLNLTPLSVFTPLNASRCRLKPPGFSLVRAWFRLSPFWSLRVSHKNATIYLFSVLSCHHHSAMCFTWTPSAINILMHFIYHNFESRYMITYYIHNAVSSEKIWEPGEGPLAAPWLVRSREVRLHPLLKAYIHLWFRLNCFMTWCLAHNLPLWSHGGVASLSVSHSKEVVAFVLISHSEGSVANLRHFLTTQYWITVFCTKSPLKCWLIWIYFTHWFENEVLRYLKTDTQSYMSFERNFVNRIINKWWMKVNKKKKQGETAGGSKFHVRQIHFLTIPPQAPSHHLAGFPPHDQWNLDVRSACERRSVKILTSLLHLIQTR